VYVIGGEGGKEGGPLLRIPPEVGGKVACGRFDSGSLRSIGFDPVPADEAVTARCQGALDIVQRDLDVTGSGHYRMLAQLGRIGL
jgi:hypothetical protein